MIGHDGLTFSTANPMPKRNSPKSDCQRNNSGDGNNLKKELHQLSPRKALPEMRIEDDGDTITVYGVGDGFARHRSDWFAGSRRKVISVTAPVSSVLK